jgi:SAM-dependent methyltransferase
MTDPQFTGERCVPGKSPADNFFQSVERYRFAVSRLGSPALVLDAACGTGLGSTLLSGNAANVIGLDIDQGALTFAVQRYGTYRLPPSFCRGDLENLPLVSNSLDALVAFEAIEHLRHPNRFVAEAHRVLSRNGILIISTPAAEAEQFKDNPFHLSIFTIEELTALLSPYFEVVSCSYQGTVSPSTLRSLRIKFQIRKPLKRFHLMDAARAARARFQTYARLNSDLPHEPDLNDMTRSSPWAVRSLDSLPPTHIPHVIVFECRRHNSKPSPTSEAPSRH